MTKTIEVPIEFIEQIVEQAVVDGRSMVEFLGEDFYLVEDMPSWWLKLNLLLKGKSDCYYDLDLYQ